MVTGHARRLGGSEQTSSVIVQEDMSEKHVRSHRRPVIWLSWRGGPAGMGAFAATKPQVTFSTTVFVPLGGLGNSVKCIPIYPLL